MSLRLATWNINSIRLRIDTVGRFAEEENPDIICLQETKTPDEFFPLEAVQAMGYGHTVFAGQKGYNGVAILSRVPLANVYEERFLGSEDKRHIAAQLPDGSWLHNFYVPAGGDVPDVKVNPKFGFKLDFLDAMRGYFADARWKGEKAILVGDLNIAPHENDVWSHKQLLKVISHTPIEVEKLETVRQTLNWLDTGRHGLSDEEKVYSWWSYRGKDWAASDRGRRLDHIWLTPALKDAFLRVRHLRPLRGWEQPSDHVPVVADLQLAC